MNCREFDEVVNCLARDQMMEASVKAKAQTHVASCESCRAGLEDERKLTASLRALAVETASIGASAACEEYLMNVFEAEVVCSARRSSRPRWAYAVGAVAAMFLLMIGISVWRSRSVKTLQLTSASAFGVAITSTGDSYPASLSAQLPFVSHSMRTGGRSRNLRQPLTRSAPKASEEIATDFIPVTYGNSGLEAGSQIVRIELPRSTLANFGLPMNMDRADHPVKADVLVGLDGVARAIRFVQ